MYQGINSIKINTINSYTHTSFQKALYQHEPCYLEDSNFSFHMYFL